MYTIGYRRKRFVKVFLIIVAFIISLASLLYTNYLVQKLMEEEQKQMSLWAESYESWAAINMSSDNTSGNQEYSEFLFSIIRENETIPLIATDEAGNILVTRNLDSSRVEDEKYLQNQLEEMKDQHDPFFIQDEFGGNKTYIYYKDSIIIDQLRYYPYVQLFVIGLFVILAYYAFSSSRRYEQNRVWVGMAKETAHQLGTPLSSLMGWIEYLRMKENEPVSEDTINELEKDINRLKLVTDRFSKIGSLPNLKKENVFYVVSELVDYFTTRISDRIELRIDESSDKQAEAPMNRELFNWVLENLIKNAIDAIKESGSISIRIEETGTTVFIDVSDTGKGIPKSSQATVFNPGYTTRSRSWGLGLSLAKRIIENYHNGQIFVKSSELNKGTTFRIKLPK